MPLQPELPADRLPTTLGGHFVRQAPSYGLGLILIAAYQYAHFWFDTHLSRAIDAAIGGAAAIAGQLGGALIAVALGSLVLRVLSRMAIFNAGRMAEYELRRALLYQLQQ